MDEQRYRAAERSLWDDAGITPTERRLRLRRNDVDVRVLEVGEGPAVLFIHGGPGSAGSSWARLAARLPGLRCLLLDRPGTGLSDGEPLRDAAAVHRQTETLAVDVLDALGLEQADLVGSSHGGHAALLAAAAFPDRFSRVVLLGSPGIVEGVRISTVDRLFLAPGVRHLFRLLPANARSVRSTYRQLGHGPTLDVDGIPEVDIDWAVALQRHTDTMANDLQLMAQMGTFRGGFDRSLWIDRELLASVPQPTYVLWGTEEVYGDGTVARWLVDTMPAAELEMMDRAGHLCWFDDVDRAAAVVRSHLLTDSDVPTRERQLP